MNQFSPGRSRPLELSLPGKPELVLSNTTTFFSGNLENLFKKAKKYGFKYLEIIPYRSSTPQEIFDFEQKYNLEAKGIHLPPGSPKTLFEKILGLIFNFYLGPLKENPALEIAQALQTKKRDFYLLLHADSALEMRQTSQNLTKKFPVVIENVLYHEKYPAVFWDPLKIRQAYPAAGLAFDPGHFETTPNYPSRLLETYQTAKPEIIHISYGSFPPHILPNQKQQEELRQMLAIHQPKYIVLETNPLVSVKKGKEMLEKIINLS